MKRKLNASLIALSTSGLFLAVALLAGRPLEDGAAPAVPGVAALAGDSIEEDATEASRPARRGPRSARRGLAMPYFSFAHGLRRVGG